MDDRVKAVLEVLVVEAVFFILAWYFEYLFDRDYGWFSKIVMILLGFIGIFLHGKPREYGLVPRNLEFSLKWCFYVVLIFSFTSIVAILVSVFVETFKMVSFHTLLIDLLWFMVFVGFAEELFFRGYVQSRLSEVFTKRYERFLGVKLQWGQGALVTGVVFFGLPHLLVAINPFTGRVSFSPLIFIMTLFACFIGVLLGVMREKTGCVLVPSIVHGALDYTAFSVGRLTGLAISNIASAVALFLFIYLMLQKFSKNS